MADPFLGEIRLFGFSYAPQGWAKCDGQLLQIQQNNALYSLLGIRYGGDGRTNFNLPDLRGRVPLHRGTGYTIGQKGGVEGVSLTYDTLPAHNHPAYGTTAPGDTWKPNSATALATSTDATDPIYLAPQTSMLSMNAAVISVSGGNQPHNNMQPSLVLNFCIATTGIYPPRS